MGRRRLSHALKAAREAAGKTRAEVAAAMDWSLSKVIRIEAGTVGISTIDARALTGLYGITEPDRVEEILGLARNSRLRTWWSTLRDRVNPSYYAYIGLEDESVEVLYFAPTTLPTLLQTRGFAAGGAPVRPMDEDDRDTRINVRLRRQEEILNKRRPPRITAIIDEAVLHRIAHAPKRAPEQLTHLVSLSASPHITIQVLPFSAGPPPVVAPFAILQFPDPEDADVMFVENAVTDEVIDRPEEVRPYLDVFRELRDKALDPAESLAMIKEIVGGE
ncbi:helix-turn-helix domain-containing protein [Catenuloplanes atrovinosus]|uniref:Transcriptional regulator with XRE-family HTH domain n=1 Tax=Catenuloplanes atrovinosus TaxID=137266 RepID=A0AAE3YT82_9ACTN|nr:helix-turn-helix transcriptional regulator [Catenuloplanes atrovinosus]MDR7278812.1 transcriptional regulator with XRE-family HTH domain [Catenuloplanes atrovinosus]